MSKQSDEIARYAAAIAADWPPLTDEQVGRVVAALRGCAPVPSPPAPLPPAEPHIAVTVVIGDHDPGPYSGARGYAYLAPARAKLGDRVLLPPAWHGGRARRGVIVSLDSDYDGELVAVTALLVGGRDV